MELLGQVVYSGAPRKPLYRRILGINFFCGSVQEVIQRMDSGGLLVVPAAPALKTLVTDPEYREALLAADLVIPDSAYMVLLWRLFEWVPIRRLSGLEYMAALLLEPPMQIPGNTFWVMANERSAKCNLLWLAERGITVPSSCVHIAPQYEKIEDFVLLDKIKRLRPQHVVITIGGGPQERLGLYLKRSLPYLPAIHCTGAAIAFLSGDQVRISALIDKMQLGWLARIVSDPRRFIPRYVNALSLWQLVFRYRSELPPLLPASKTRG